MSRNEVLDAMEYEKRIQELERAHAELRGALIFAGRRIRQLRKNDQSLAVLRQVLKEARAHSPRREPRSQARPIGRRWFDNDLFEES